MPIGTDSENSSEELLFQMKRSNSNKPIIIAIILVIVVSAFAMTGVYLGYW